MAGGPFRFLLQVGPGPADTVGMRYNEPPCPLSIGPVVEPYPVGRYGPVAAPIKLPAWPLPYDRGSALAVAALYR